jgi:hypothetical protein
MDGALVTVSSLYLKEKRSLPPQVNLHLHSCLLANPFGFLSKSVSVQILPHDQP